MHNNWLNSPAYNPKHPNALEFKTYAELIYELEPETRQYKPVGMDSFSRWLDGYFKEHAELGTTLRSVIHEKANLNKYVYQECRLMSNQEEYRDIGSKDSLFPSPGDTKTRYAFRDNLYQILKDHRHHLKTKQQIDFSFYEIDWNKHAGIFDKVVVDEAQDSSSTQLKVASHAGKNSSYFLDTNQSCDYLSKIPFLKKMLGPSHRHFHLSTSLRCSTLVTKIAEAILAMKYYLVGLIENSIPFNIETAQNKPGEVLWPETGIPDPEEKKTLDGRVKVLEMCSGSPTRIFGAGPCGISRSLSLNA